MYNERRMKVLFGLFSAAALCLFSGCYRPVEYTLAEIEAMQTDGSDYIEARTSYKPWRGENPVDGIPGGVLYESITNDPKTFNLLVAERDAETLGVVSHMYDPLLDYDYVRHEFIPRCASAEIIPDEEAGTLSVIYTLREDLYWSFFGKEEKIPVTSDDVIFWYNEIEGDPAFHSSAYNSRFVEMEDGTTAEITVEKIDDKRFAFHLPRMDANALLSTNRIFGPAFIFREAKERGGTRAVLDLFSVASDPRQIPSMGMWFLVEYTPGQRLVYRRNPDYWNKDGNGFFDCIEYDLDGDKQFETAVDLLALGIDDKCGLIDISGFTYEDYTRLAVDMADGMWRNAADAVKVARLYGVETMWYAKLMQAASIRQRYNNGYWLQFYLYRDMAHMLRMKGDEAMLKKLDAAYYSGDWGLLLK